MLMTTIYNIFISESNKSNLTKNAISMTLIEWFYNNYITKNVEK